MSPVLTLLNEMRGRPVAIYVGTSSLTLLAAFLRGYDYAVERLNEGRLDPFLGEFQQWIRRRFQSDKYTWDHTILLHSADEHAAVQRFWELLDEYLHERATETSSSGSHSAQEPRKANGVPNPQARRELAG